jgi:hypothetical protein
MNLTDDEIWTADILAIALELHMNRYGSSDSYATWCQPEGTREKHISILKARVTLWKEGRSESNQFDQAVKSVILAAITEWEPGWSSPGSN